MRYRLVCGDCGFGTVIGRDLLHGMKVTLYCQGCGGEQYARVDDSWHQPGRSPRTIFAKIMAREEAT